LQERKKTPEGHAADFAKPCGAGSEEPLAQFMILRARGSMRRAGRLGAVNKLNAPPAPHWLRTTYDFAAAQQDQHVILPEANSEDAT